MLHSASLEAMRVIKEYTYSEYNAVRNELAHILWDIFKDDVERETKKELGI